MSCKGTRTEIQNLDGLEEQVKKLPQQAKIPKQSQAYKQKWALPNNERKSYQQLVWECMSSYQQPNLKEAKHFGCVIWEWNEPNKEVEWTNKIKKELKGLEEGPEVEIQLESFRGNTDKVPNRKTSGYDGIHCFWTEYIFKRKNVSEWMT